MNTMAEHNSADDDSTETQNTADPELLATTEAEAEKSLQVHMTRDEMRQACRDWELEGYSGPKAEMAGEMLKQAPEQAVGFLAEAGVAIEGDLAAQYAEEPEQDEAEQEAEDEDEDQDSGSSGQQAALAGDLLAEDPSDYRHGKLQMTEKQTAVIAAAFADLEGTQEEVAEAAECTRRYANTTLKRWRGSDDEVEAMAQENVQVPTEYRENEVLN